MNIQEIIKRLRDRTNTTEKHISDADMLEIIEDAVTIIRTEIIYRVGEEYLYDILTTNLWQWQQEYELSRQSETTKGMAKVISVALKKKPDAKYEPLYAIQIGNRQNLSEYPDRYSVRDNSIFLSYTPENDVIDGLRIEALVHPKKLTLQSTEEDIGIPREVQEIIITVAKMLVYEQKKLWNEYNIAVNDLVGNKGVRGWDWMTRILTDRVASSIEAEHLSPYIFR